MEVRIAKHIKQLRSRGSGLRQLFGRIRPEPLMVANLSHLSDRSLIIWIICQLCTEFALSFVQVAIFQRKDACVCMCAANLRIDFQRMMKIAQAIVGVSHEE